MQNACFEDSYYVNMIINLLVRFPEIFTVSYSLSSSSYSVSYMVTGRVDQKKFSSLRRKIEVYLEAYRYFKKKEHSRITLQKKFYYGFTLFETNLIDSDLAAEEVSLITRLFREDFEKSLINELRPEDVESADEGSANWEEIFPLLSNRNPNNAVNKLFAFRDAGKVYIYDQ